MKLTYNDREHAYWLDGRRCKGVTSVASYPDDKYAINQWRERRIVVGLATKPALVHRAAAHFDERDKIQEIAEEALVAAAAHDASGRGTADHRTTERMDLGLEWIDTPETRAIRTAWTQALDHAGVDIDPQLVERIVVYPDLLIAGRFDRIGRYRATGRPVVVDVKTGENAIKYPHSTTVQCGLYANAPLMATNMRRGKNRDGEWIEWTDTFEPLPDDLHRDHAIVVYLPPEGPGQCHRINIGRGWDAATTVCFPIISWRKTAKTDLVEPLEAQATVTPASPERVTWVRGRVQAIIDAGHQDELADIWNLDKVPAPLTATTVLSDAQVNVLVGWCSGIEALAGIPFEPTDPLFQPFTPKVSEPAQPPPQPEPDRGEEEARRWADEARRTLSEFDDGELRAILKAAFMTGHEPMTLERFQRLEVLACQASGSPNSAVLFNYGPEGPTVVPAPDAEARMVAAAGSRGEAKERAARVAKQAGRIAPRSLAKAAEIPLYAAMVAAGHGATNNSIKEQALT